MLQPPKDRKLSLISHNLIPALLARILQHFELQNLLCLRLMINNRSPPTKLLKHSMLRRCCTAEALANALKAVAIAGENKEDWTLPRRTRTKLTTKSTD
jgi:hypothetical protein